MLGKSYMKPYNIIQYIRTDEYITFAELSEKTNTNVETLKKQLASLKKQYAKYGYSIKTDSNGIKLLKGDTEYLPIDLILFDSDKYDFITIFMKFISEGQSDFDIFNKMYLDLFYTKRQVRYFFKSCFNLSFSNFKQLSSFEIFSIFVEYCTLWFNCRNIKNLFDEYIEIEQFNKLMLKYPRCNEVSPVDYLTIYSVLVFDKMNPIEMNYEYKLIVHYFKSKKYMEGLAYYKQVTKYTQKSYTVGSVIDYYFSINNIENNDYSIDVFYKNIDIIGYELEHLQKEITTEVISDKSFDFTIIYEDRLAVLSVIKGALRKNYPNINIICIPSWLYLYGNPCLSGIVCSNTNMDFDIRVIGPRDENGNYNLDLKESLV